MRSKMYQYVCTFDMFAHSTFDMFAHSTFFLYTGTLGDARGTH